MGGEHIVGVGDPGHFTLARAHIRSGDIDTRPDKIFAHQLGGVPTGNALQLVNLEVSWIDGNAALGAAKRHVDNGAFQRHQRGQGGNLIEVDWGSMAKAAVGWEAVLGVCGGVGG
jgi:hypothetical protein